MKKNICLTVIILSIIIVSSVSFAQQEATTTEGRKVILNKDGTWEYDEESAITKDKPGTKATPGDCSDYIRIAEDEVTGTKKIATKLLLVTKDKNKTGFGIFGMAIRKEESIVVFIRPSGAGNCIDEDDKINILFRDGSRIELENDGDFNCEPDTRLFFGEGLGKEQEFEQLMTKEIKTMRVWTTDGYVQEDFTKQNSIDFMMSLKCLNEYIE